MILHYQSADGHTTLEGLTDKEVDFMFAQLVLEHRRAFIETNLDRLAPHDFVTSVADARRRGAKAIYFTGPMAGG